MAAYDEVLSRAPDYIEAYNNNGNALLGRGILLADLSRYDVAEEVFADALAASDEALSCAPDDTYALFNKALAFFRWGSLCDPLSNMRSRAADGKQHRPTASAPLL
jgi:tetratricopeptide (TPR) repeat protein